MFFARGRFRVPALTEAGHGARPVAVGVDRSWHISVCVRAQEDAGYHARCPWQFLRGRPSRDYCNATPFAAGGAVVRVGSGAEHLGLHWEANWLVNRGCGAEGR